MAPSSNGIIADGGRVRPRGAWAMRSSMNAANRCARSAGIAPSPCSVTTTPDRCVRPLPDHSGVTYAEVMPPSMISDWPVIQLDFVAGEEQRTVGDLDRLAEAAHRDVHEAAVALRVVAQELGEQRGHDRPGAQRVGAQALAGVDRGDLAGHREHGALRGGVGDLRRGRTHVGDERGDVDDRRGLAALLGALQHLRDRVLAAEQHAEDVDVHRLLVRLDRWW